MAEDTLISALEEDARAQASRVLEEAREAAEAALEEARAEAKALEESSFMELDSSLKRKRAALLNLAATKASGEKLKVRHALIDRALEEAGKRFSAMPEDEYRRFLGRLFSELRGDWERGRPGESPVVFVNPADVALVETSYEVKADERVVQGVVFASKDGVVRFENTVPGRLMRAKAMMVPAMNELLFGEVLA